MTIDDEPPDSDDVELSRLRRWSTLTLEDEAALGPGSVRPAQGGNPAGRFLLADGRPAGEAGDSAVAYDTLLDRKVLLRFVVSSSGPPGTLAAVLREAAALARLSHANLIKVHDVGVLDGRPFVAVEMVQGVTLAAWGAERRRSDREIAEVVAAAASGLAAAHAHGVEHGALSPDSIVIQQGRVVVTGFDRRPASPPDLAADVRGLGAVLFTLVHGRPPGNDPVPPPRDRGRARLHRVALRALGSEPPSAEALARTLGADPVRRTRQLAVVVAAAAVAIGAFVGGARLQGRPERRCLAGAGALAELWNDGRRAELDRRYAGVPGAAARWAALARTLDDYGARWRGAYAQACRAAYGWRPTPGPLLDRRMRCLASGRLSVEALLGTLAAARPEQLAAAGPLEPVDISRCAAITRLEQRPPPGDPRSRIALENVERLLSRALAQNNLGAYAASAATAAEAVQIARGVGHDPTLADALVQEGSALIDAGSDADTGKAGSGFDHAAHVLEEAALAAERGGDDRNRLRALIQMIALQSRRQRYAEAERWARQAEALLAREGVPPKRASQVEHTIGYLRKAQNRRAEARAAFRKALEYAEKAVPQEPHQIATTQSSVCQELDAGAEQIACARRALEMGRAAFGADNPEVAIYEAILGEALVRVPGSHREGCQMFRRARATMGGSVDAANPNAISIRIELAECLTHEAEIPEARRLLEEVIALRPGPNDLADARQLRAFLEARHGDVDLALHEQRQALAGYRALFEGCDERVAHAESQLAALLARRGQRSEAQRIARQGLAACERAGVESARSVDLRAREGRLLLDGGQLEPARRAFDEALRRHGKLGSDERALAFTLHGLGAALLGLGRTDQAVAVLERGYRARPAVNESPPELRADLALALARGLRARDRERACSLGREAASGYGRLAAFARERREAERWLAGQRCTPSS